MKSGTPSQTEFDFVRPKEAKFVIMICITENYCFSALNREIEVLIMRNMRQPIPSCQIGALKKW